MEGRIEALKSALSMTSRDLRASGLHQGLSYLSSPLAWFAAERVVGRIAFVGYRLLFTFPPGSFLALFFLTDKAIFSFLARRVGVSSR